MIPLRRRKNANPKQDAAAQLALHLSNDDTPQGAKPNPEELALLSEGRLTKQHGQQRYQEVLSHLHADSELLTHWLTVAELSQPQTTQTTAPEGLIQRLFNLRLGAALSTAVIACVALFLTLKPNDHSIAPSPARQAASYAETADLTIHINLAAGAIAALQGLSEADRVLVLEGMAQPAAPTVPYPEHRFAHQYGSALTQARLSCRQGEPLSFQQTQRLHALQSALKLPIDADCWTLNQQWRQALR